MLDPAMAQSAEWEQRLARKAESSLALEAKRLEMKRAKDRTYRVRIKAAKLAAAVFPVFVHPLLVPTIHGLLEFGVDIRDRKPEIVVRYSDNMREYGFFLVVLNDKLEKITLSMTFGGSGPNLSVHEGDDKVRQRSVNYLVSCALENMKALSA